MIGEDNFTCAWFWKVAWMGIMPSMLLLTMLFMLYENKGVSYQQYVAPVWALVLGWLLTLSLLSVVPIYAIWLLRQHRRRDVGKWSLKTALLQLTQPSVDWHPQLPQFQKEELPAHPTLEGEGEVDDDVFK